MKDLELKTGKHTWLKVSIPDKDGDFEVEIESWEEFLQCYINKEDATQLRDFLNQFLES